jgi:O-antigen biosynthesis protein
LTQNNLALLKGCLSSLQESIDASRVPFEVICVFNGTDADVVRTFVKSLRGVRDIRASANLGFGGGNNFAAKRARGKYLVFLNDDTVTQRNWLEALVCTAEQMPEAGALGSRILFPDGTLQEAGGIIWSDGSTRPLGRGAAPGSLAYSYLRRVDYASANGLLVRRELFEALGGFDSRFFPAYYEDTDLCLGIRHTLGSEVYYEPRSMIYHVEAASSPSNDFRAFLFRRNQELLAKKWAGALATYARPEPDSTVAVERAVLRRRGTIARVLVIDDRLPDAGRSSGGLGSGFVRARELFEDLNRSEFAVSIYPSDANVRTHDNPLSVLGVDVIAEKLTDHLEKAEKRYDAVLISRPHNFAAFYDDIRRLQPNATIVYDAEALYHKRLWIQARFEATAAQREVVARQASAMEELETRIARSADRIVVISHEEREWLESIADHSPIDFIRPLLSGIQFTDAAPSQRGGAIFVAGWLGGMASPNVDAVRWYSECIVPRLLAAMPEFRTSVTGRGVPACIQALGNRNLVFSGFVNSIAGLYAAARVVVVPTRIGAGVKNKTMEALQFGVPVVSTSVGAQGLGLRDEAQIDITDDPEDFARRIVALATDDGLWLQRRTAIQQRLLEWESERISWRDVIARALSVASNR